MIRNLIISLLFIGFNLQSLDVLAQDTSSVKRPRQRTKNHSNWVDRLVLGGNVGLQFGQITFVNLSPIVGYRLIDQLTIGAGPIYQYYNNKQISPEIKATTFGANGFGRYNFLPNLYAHGELEHLNVPLTGVINDRTTVNSVLLGGGFSQQLSNRAFLNLTALWNVNDSPLYPTRVPIIRGGITFGF